MRSHKRNQNPNKARAKAGIQISPSFALRDSTTSHCSVGKLLSAYDVDAGHVAEHVKGDSDVNNSVRKTVRGGSAGVETVPVWSRLCRLTHHLTESSFLHVMLWHMWAHWGIDVVARVGVCVYGLGSSPAFAAEAAILSGDSYWSSAVVGKGQPVWWTGGCLPTQSCWFACGVGCRWHELRRGAMLATEWS
eukprot:1837394-Amphidinium_carterae.1